MEWTHRDYTITLDEREGHFLVKFDDMYPKRFGALADAKAAIDKNIKDATPHGTFSLPVLCGSKPFTLRGAHRGHGTFLTEEGETLRSSVYPDTDWVRGVLAEAQRIDGLREGNNAKLEGLSLSASRGYYGRYSGPEGNQHLQDDYAEKLRLAQERERNDKS